MLKNPSGYDLHAVSFGIWNDNYKKNVANYGLRSEMVFAFQLFLSGLSRGGKGLLNRPTAVLISTTPKQDMERIRIIKIFLFRSTIRHFVLKANGKNEGLQLMRFNPGYWNKSLPPSAIQLMTFGYPQMTSAQMEEYSKTGILITISYW